MIRWSRILVFVILVAAVFATIAWTAEDVVNNITLGLDLQGGFEVLYEAKPLNEGQQITQETLAAAAAAVRARVVSSNQIPRKVWVQLSLKLRVGVECAMLLLPALKLRGLSHDL